MNGGISPIPIALPLVKTDHLIVGKEILLRLAKRATACKENSRLAIILGQGEYKQRGSTMSGVVSKLPG